MDFCIFHYAQVQTITAGLYNIHRISTSARLAPYCAGIRRHAMTRRTRPSALVRVQVKFSKFWNYILLSVRSKTLDRFLLSNVQTMYYTHNLHVSHRCNFWNLREQSEVCTLAVSVVINHGYDIRLMLRKRKRFDFSSRWKFHFSLS